MFKKAVLLLLIACLTLTVCGCGAETADKDSKSSSADIYTDSSSENIVTSKDEEGISSIASKVESSSDLAENNAGSSGISGGASSTVSVQSRPGGSSSVNSTVSNTSSKSQVPDKERRILIRQVNRKYFKELGRCDIKSTTGFYLANACASVEFDLLCKNTISLEFSKSSGSSAWLEIYVDGKLIAERTEISQTGTYQIASNLPEGVHRVKILRQTDADGAQLYFNAINTYGSLVEKAPENKKLYIEAIGDASLIGWGVRLEDEFFKDFKTSTHQSTARALENRDATLAYPYVAAQKLDADCYILARQGSGIAATYHTKTMVVNGASTVIGNNTQSGGLLPVLNRYATTNSSRLHTPTRTPDVIVLDAGAADMSASLLKQVYDNGKVGINQERAKEIAKDFLLELKENNPGAKIIWCYGMVSRNDALKAHIQDVIKRAGGEAADIHFLELETTKRSGYPSKSEYEAAAVLLANKIKSIT